MYAHTTYPYIITYRHLHALVYIHVHNCTYVYQCLCIHTHSYRRTPWMYLADAQRWPPVWPVQAPGRVLSELWGQIPGMNHFFCGSIVMIYSNTGLGIDAPF